MTRIVTTHYHYRPPPKKRKAVPLAGPAVVTPKRRQPAVVKKPEPASVIVRKTKPCNDNRPEASSTSVDGPPKSAIVTARMPGKRYVDVPDMTPEEHQRRGQAANALWRELVRRAGGNDR